ncbi:hypothetical protein pb186bvf_004868 [Paramecium bursaria]
MNQIKNPIIGYIQYFKIIIRNSYKTIVFQLMGNLINDNPSPHNTHINIS